MPRRTYVSLIALAALFAAPAATLLAETYSLPETQLPTLTRVSDGSPVDPNSLSPNTGLAAIGIPAVNYFHPELTGAGQTVVVIDTGIDYTHPALASNYLTGYDFVNNIPDPIDNIAVTGGHGTHVAGIIASTDPTYPGVAPGTKVISLKVFDSSGQASDTNVLAALQWVSDHKTQYNITTVNMSLGDGTESTLSSIPADNPYDVALHTLKNQGVFVSVASGNDAYLHGQSMPAASRYAVSVGATYANNNYNDYVIGYDDPTILDPYLWPDIFGNPQTARDVDYGPRQNDIAFFSNRYQTDTDGSTTLMAPGIFIHSTVPLAFDDDGTPDGFTDMAGTSMAAPYVAGAAILVRQALEEAGLLNPDPAQQVDQILSILKVTGTDLVDYSYFFGGNNATIMFIPADSNTAYIGRGTGDTFELINVSAAVNSILGLPEPASLGMLVIGASSLLLRRHRNAGVPARRS